MLVITLANPLNNNYACVFLRLGMTLEFGKGAGANGAGENQKMNDMMNDKAHSPKRI